MNKNSHNTNHIISSNRNAPRLAMIGCGAIAEIYYLPALAKHPQSRETLILVDQNPARAQKLAATFGCKKYFTDYRQVLDNIDGAIVALPTHLHHPVACEFLKRQIPVLCEKPLAETAVKAVEMIDLAHKTNTPLATNYAQRLWSQFAAIKEMIANGEYGEVTSIKYNVGEAFSWPTVSGFYFNSTADRRGVLLDRGAHVVDHICWWLEGKPEILKTQNDSFGGIETVSYIKFGFKNCIGEINLNWLSNFPSKFVVTFEHGTVTGDVAYPQSIQVETKDGHQRRIKLRAESWFALGEKIVNNFIRVISLGEKPLVPGSGVLDSMKMIDECYAKATPFEMPWYEDLEVKHG